MILEIFIPLQKLIIYFVKKNDYYLKSEIDQKLALIINNPSGILDSITELANALNNDSNYATTITTALGLKANTSYVDGKFLLYDRNK